jgi:hypothetical protein
MMFRRQEEPQRKEIANEFAEVIRWGVRGALLAGIGWMASGFFFYVFPGEGDGPEGSLSWYLIESADAVAEAGMLAALVGLHIRQTQLRAAGNGGLRIGHRRDGVRALVYRHLAPRGREQCLRRPTVHFRTLCGLARRVHTSRRGVVGLYVLVVGSLGTLLQTRENFVVPLFAAGLVAALFAPLRNRLQRGVNHLMYGERDDPYAVLSRLGQHLESTLAPDAVLPTVVGTVKEALKLRRRSSAVTASWNRFLRAVRACALLCPAPSLPEPETYGIVRAWRRFRSGKSERGSATRPHRRRPSLLPRRFARAAGGDARHRAGWRGRRTGTRRSRWPLSFRRT